METSYSSTKRRFRFRYVVWLLVCLVILKVYNHQPDQQPPTSEMETAHSKEIPKSSVKNKESFPLLPLVVVGAIILTINWIIGDDPPKKPESQADREAYDMQKRREYNMERMNAESHR